MESELEGWFEDRASAGRWLAERMGGSNDLHEAVVVALSDGGQEVAEALVGPGGRIHRVESFVAVGRLPLEPALVILVDDGERAPEELGAVAWALLAIRPRELVVVVPVASRWLEAALPLEVRVHVGRRYTPTWSEAFLYADDQRRFEEHLERGFGARRERRPLPPRTGRPWDPAEEEQLDALVKEGVAVADIAERLGRTRGGVESRIARRAVERGARETASPPVSG